MNKYHLIIESEADINPGSPNHWEALLLNKGNKFNIIEAYRENETL